MVGEDHVQIGRLQRHSQPQVVRSWGINVTALDACKVQAANALATHTNVGSSKFFSPSQILYTLSCRTGSLLTAPCGTLGIDGSGYFIGGQRHQTLKDTRPRLALSVLMVLECFRGPIMPNPISFCT